MPTIADERGDQTLPWGFVVSVDTFLSWWGGASGGTSYYAIAVRTEAEAAIVLNNAKHRSGMRRVRLIRGDVKFMKLKAGDHLCVVNWELASCWYEPNFGGPRSVQAGTPTALPDSVTRPGLHRALEIVVGTGRKSGSGTKPLKPKSKSKPEPVTK